MDNEQVEVRKAKLKKISEKVKAYPERYETTHKLSEVASLEDGTQNVSIAGRILAKRGHGKMAFIVLSDIEGKAQASMKYDLLGEEKFNFFMDNIDIGDFIGVTGEVFTTHTGEKTVRAAD